MNYPGLSLFIGLLLLPVFSWSQALIKGQVVEAESLKPLPWVHVYSKSSRIGTTSLSDGTFTLSVNSSIDTLFISLVGYQELRLSVQEFLRQKRHLIQLTEQSTTLKAVDIRKSKLVERRFGIRKRTPLIHFTDGMFQAADTFEIGQVIELGNQTSQVTALQLYVTEPRTDSASFRIHFYRMENNYPTTLLGQSRIFEATPIREGWLTFDLQSENIFIKGSFLATLEFMPQSGSAPSKPISYEIKLGGHSKSFYRKKATPTWRTPPHHYCLSITARVDPSQKQEEEVETAPAFSLPSKVVSDTFHLFVQLPPSYHQKTDQSYPVLYVLDANAYFDQVSDLSSSGSKKKRSESIVVGIGYKNAYLMDSLRVRDYTFPAAQPSDSLPISGGGERFYSFLTSELIPEIDRLYRTDAKNRTLMGHSFGGYFTLYALLKETASKPVFHHFLAASPSIWYSQGYLTKALQRYDPSINRSLFLTTGKAEGSTQEFTTLVTLLKNHPSLQVHSKIYNGLDHMGTVLPSFRDGLLLMRKKE